MGGTDPLSAIVPAVPRELGLVPLYDIPAVGRSAMAEVVAMRKGSVGAPVPRFDIPGEQASAMVAQMFVTDDVRVQELARLAEMRPGQRIKGVDLVRTSERAIEVKVMHAPGATVNTDETGLLELPHDPLSGVFMAKSGDYVIVIKCSAALSDADTAAAVVAETCEASAHRPMNSPPPRPVRKSRSRPVCPHRHAATQSTNVTDGRS